MSQTKTESLLRAISRETPKRITSSLLMFTPFDANSNAKIVGQKDGTCSYFLMKETEMVWMDPLNYVWEGGKRAKRFKVVHLEGKNIFVFWDESY